MLRAEDTARGHHGHKSTRERGIGGPAGPGWPEAGVQDSQGAAGEDSLASCTGELSLRSAVSGE